MESARMILKVGKRRLVDEVRSGSSYLSQNDPRVHFGLGSSMQIDSLEIRWRSGLVEKYASLPRGGNVWS